MPYTIKCSFPFCGKLTLGGNIVELLRDHRDGAGWFYAVHATRQRASSSDGFGSKKKASIGNPICAEPSFWGR
jgi:hypothetical protein